MPAAGQAQKAFFGCFEVDLHAGELRKLGVKIKLREKSFAVLALLLDHPSELVSRDELRARLWPADVFVDFDNNLNSAVTKLREALGDSAEKPRYIETLPKRGYRFIAPVAFRDAGSAQRRPGQVRLAVLPFANLSGDPGQEYFSDGITEELITELACVAPDRLCVIARTSAMRYRGTRKDVSRIGRELDISHLVEGSVRRWGGRVRVSAQLIRTEDQTHLWAQNFESELSDALRMQAEIARSIAQHVDVKLGAVVAGSSSRIHPVNPEAYDAYLLGLHQYNHASPASLEKADEYFRLALEQDPEFAPAYAKAAMAHAFCAYFGYAPAAAAYPKAEAAARRALELDGALADAHNALATVHWFHHWNPEQCERALEYALGLCPNDPALHWAKAMFLASMREDHEGAAAEATLALAADPLSIMIRSMICWLPYWARQFDQAIAQARTTIELDPQASQAFYVLGVACRAKGNFKEAVDVLERSAARFGDPLSLGYLGMAYGLAGQSAEARGVLKRLEQRCAPRRPPAILSAFVYAGLGEHAAALDHIELAFAEHDAFVLWLRVSPDWDLLRNEPRFGRFLERLKLPATRAAHVS